MKTIIGFQKKGGDCKTTFALNTSYAFAENGLNVMLADLDDQQNSSRSIACSKDAKLNIEDLILNDNIHINEVLIKTDWPNVWILPSTSNLSGVIHHLSNELGGYHILGEKLKQAEGFDYCFLDPSPSLNILNISGFCASQFAFVPMSTKYFSLEGLKQSLEAFGKIKKRLNSAIRLLGIGFANYDKRTVLSNEIVRQVRRKYPDLLFKSMVGVNIKIEESLTKKQSILQYAPTDRGAIQYRKLAAELLERIDSMSDIATPVLKGALNG